MKTANFKEWSLTKLDRTFDLIQILASECQTKKSSHLNFFFVSTGYLKTVRTIGMKSNENNYSLK